MGERMGLLFPSSSLLLLTSLPGVEPTQVHGKQQYRMSVSPVPKEKGGLMITAQHCWTSSRIGLLHVTYTGTYCLALITTPTH